MRTILILTAFITVPVFAQNFDTSNNAALHGDYFVREILITGQNNDGTIASASSAIGVATFDGNGNYTFTGAAGRNVTGVYGVGSNGLLFIQSFIDGTQNAYGGLSGVGPYAVVASATGGTSGDILVAIPAGTSVSASALSGNYTAGYVSFPNSDVTQVRQASFNFTADGAGNLSNVKVSGVALNLGGNTVSQTISGATYSLSGEGSGMVNLGATSSSQVLSGSMNFYLSSDGNIFMAGTPGGVDLVVGTRALSGAASNATWNNVYFIAGLEDSVQANSHSLDAFYGSWNANGQGGSIAHQRYQSLAPLEQVYDYTFNSQTTVQSNGTASPADLAYQFTLGAGGQVFIAAGTQGLYSLMIGFAAPQFSGSGVFLNPLGVVNGANYAPITNPIAPGEIITLFGSGLASGVFTAGLPLPTTLGGVQVNINGQAVPLYYVSPTQITALVPQQVTPDNNVFVATIQVVNNGAMSNSTTVYTNYTAPGVFSADGSGGGPAAAQVNNAAVSPTNPANVGSTVVFYATGLGTVTPVVADGAAAPSNPPATADDTDLMYIGGQQANLVFDGLAPGFASLFQLNAAIATGTPSGQDFADVSTPDAYSSMATLQVGATGSGRLLARAQDRAALRTVVPRAGRPERGRSAK
jgi:uncharacterized protein (TIGR03437 family)